MGDKMKKVLKTAIIILIFSILININYSCFAATKSTSGGTIDTLITSDNFVKDLDPNNSPANDGVSSKLVSFIQSVINPVMGIVQMIGGIVMVISIAIYGISLLVAGNKELAKDLPIMANPGNIEAIKDFGRSLLIGSALLFFSSLIVQFVFRVFQLS